jgi:hypothetical protein
MYGRPGLVRRRPLLRAAAMGGTFAAGRAMGHRAAERASAETYQNQPISDLQGPPNQPLLRAGGEGQQQPLLRTTREGQQHQPLLRATREGQQHQPLLRTTREGAPNPPLLRAAGEGQHQPLMQAAPPQDTRPASAADQLSKLAELHLEGELTDEEFAAAKAMTLGRG